MPRRRSVAKLTVVIVSPTPCSTRGVDRTRVAHARAHANEDAGKHTLLDPKLDGERAPILEGNEVVRRDHLELVAIAHDVDVRKPDLESEQQHANPVRLRWIEREVFRMPVDVVLIALHSHALGAGSTRRRVGRDYGGARG